MPSVLQKRGEGMTSLHPGGVQGRHGRRSSPRLGDTRQRAPAAAENDHAVTVPGTARRIRAYGVAQRLRWAPIEIHFLQLPSRSGIGDEPAVG
jgi:hypothetical protein